MLKRTLNVVYVLLLLQCAALAQITGGGGSGSGVGIFAVAGLPGGQTVGTVAVVNNGASGTDCTVGGGANLVFCRWGGATWATFAAGAASAGGSNTQLQYNTSGSLGGIAQWTTNGTTTVTGSASSVFDVSAATITNVKLPAAIAGSGLNYTAQVLGITTGGVTNAMLANSVVTLPTGGGSGLSGGGSVSLGGSLALNIATAGVTNAMLANPATTVNSQSCTLGSTCTIPFQTNSGNNTSQAGINLLTSTVNTVGLTVTPTNTGTNQETFEITGGSYTGNAATASNATLAANLSGTPTLPAVTFGGGATVPTGQTLTVASGGTLTCAAGSTCPTGTGTVTHSVGALAPVFAPIVANAGADIQSEGGGELSIVLTGASTEVCGPINTALLAAQTANVVQPIISIKGIPINLTCNQDPFAGFNDTPHNGFTLDIGGGQITTDVPWFIPFHGRVIGTNGRGAFITASNVFHTNYSAIVGNGTTDKICLFSGSANVVAGIATAGACVQSAGTATSTATFTPSYNAAALASPPAALGSGTCSSSGAGWSGKWCIGYYLLISPNGVPPTAANTLSVGQVIDATSQSLDLAGVINGNVRIPANGQGYQFALVMPVVSLAMRNSIDPTYGDQTQFEGIGIGGSDPTQAASTGHGVDCHIGFMNNYYQENSWLRNAFMTNFCWAYIAVEGNAANSGYYGNIYALSAVDYSGYTASTGSVGIIVRQVGTMHGFRDSTFNIRSGSTLTANPALLVTNFRGGGTPTPTYGAVPFESMHLEVGDGGDAVQIGDTEAWPWAVLLGGNGEGAQSALFTNISGTPLNHTGNLIHVQNTTGAFANTNITIIGPSTEENVSTTLTCIQDDVNSVSYSNCPPMWIGPATAAATIIDGDETISGNFSANNVTSTGTGTFSALTATGAVNFRGATHTGTVQTGLIAAIPATCTAGDLYFATDQTHGQSLNECYSGNVWVQQLNSGASGMNTAASNASAVAVASSWIPGIDNSIDLGSAALRWRNEYLSGSVFWTTAGNVVDTGLCRGAAGQLDVSNGVSCAATGNIFAAGFASGSASVPGTGEISLPSSAAPSAPASGTLIWFDSTDLRVHEIGNAATIGTTVVANAGAAHRWFSALSTSGNFSDTQPGLSDLTAIFTAPLSLSSNTLSISGVTGEQGNGALLQLSTGTVNTNRITKFDANGNTINSNLIEASSLVSNAANTATTYSGALDASANAAQASTTFRGGDETGAGGASSTGGDVLIRGGNNAATNASSTAGSIFIGPGASTGATQGLQGIFGIAKQYIKAATSTQWDLACISGTTAMTVKNCGASPTSWLGVIEAVNTNTDVVLSPPSQSPINASGAVTVGDTVCAGGSAGQVTDSAGTASCTNAQGVTVGVVVAVAGTFPLGDGTTQVLSTTLPLIDMNTAGIQGTGGGSGTVTSIATTSPITGGTITTTGTIGLGTVGPANGGNGVVNPIAHSLEVAEGTANMSLLTSPSTNGNCVVSFNVTGSAPVDPTCALVGISVYTPLTPYTGLYTDRNSYQRLTGGSTFSYTLPQITGTTASNYNFMVQNNNSGLLTFTANGADAIDGSGLGGTSTLISNFAAFVQQDQTQVPGAWWTIKVPTFAAFGSTCTGVLQWSTSTGISCNTTPTLTGTNISGVVWNNLAAPSGNLSLAMGADTSIFTTTTAEAQMFAWKNITAAVVGTSQGSPIPAVCGTAFHGSASVESCATWGILPGNGNDAAITVTHGVTGTSTGTVTDTFPGGITVGSAPTVTTGTGFFLFGTEGTEPASIGASTDGFVMDSTSHCPIQWNNASNVGCSAALGAVESFTAAQTFTGGVINTTTPIRDQTRFVLVSNMTAATATVGLGTTGASNATFSWPVTAANWYDMQCKLPDTFAATGTIKFQLYSVSGSVTISAVNSETTGNTGAAAAFQDLTTIGGTTLATSVTPVTGAPGASETITYNAQFLTSHAGNIGLEFISATANSTLLAGGECGLTQIN